jgi:hypothetical protein
LLKIIHFGLLDLCKPISGQDIYLLARRGIRTLYNNAIDLLLTSAARN